MGWEVIVFIAACVAMSVACLVPNRWLPPLPNDKFMHFSGFAVLSMLALRAAGSGAERWLWLLGLLIAGWLIECLQNLVPDRSFCWRDMGANAAGIAVVAAGARISSLFI